MIEPATDQEAIAQLMALVEDIEQFAIATIDRRACDGCNIDDAMVEIINKIERFNQWYSVHSA